MRPSSGTILGISARRLALLAAVAIPVAVVLGLAALWLNDVYGRPPYWRAGLVLMNVLETAYLAAVIGILAGIPILTVLAVRARRRGVRRPLAARLLLTVASLAMCALVAESIGAVWRARVRSASAVPVGGLRPSRTPWVAPNVLWPPVTRDDVPLPDTFDDPPDDTDIDLVVVGESSAEGVPYSEWLSIGRLVAWKLWEAIPRRPVRVQIQATSGESLELQHRRLQHLTRRPELMIIYCGHNEFSARLRNGRNLPYYLDDQSPGIWTLAREQAEAISPFSELVRRTADKCELAIPPPPNGIRKLIDTPAYTTVEYALLLADFRRRLEAMVAYACRVGATVVLIIPAGNDAGFEPNRSFLPATVERADREAFGREVEAARGLEEADPAAATAAYRALIDRQPGFAEAHYRLAVLLDRAGDAEGAYREFIAARDRDGFPIRCPTAFQDVYREVAARHPVILVDAQAELHEAGRRGRLDDELFQDAMHPSLRGQLALAQAVLRGLRDRRAFGWPDQVPAASIDPAECLIRFAIGRDAWRKICLWGVHFGNHAEGLRYESALRMRLKKAYADGYERLVAGDAPEALRLPNIGTPEPVPVVAGGEPQQLTGSTAP